MIEKKKEDIEVHTPTTVGAYLRIVPICYLLYVGVIGSGIHSWSSQRTSRSCKKWFENSTALGTISTTKCAGSKTKARCCKSMTYGTFFILHIFVLFQRLGFKYREVCASLSNYSHRSAKFPTLRTWSITPNALLHILMKRLFLFTE